jgi:Domain of unknown function (DUF4296)
MKPMKWLFPLLLMLVFSCTGRNTIPSGILKQDQMEKVLYDVIIAEGYAETFLYKDSSQNKEYWMNGQLDKVLAIHKVSQETFMKSYDFYKNRPDLLKPIMDTMDAKSRRNRDKIYDKELRQTLE